MMINPLRNNLYCYGTMKKMKKQILSEQKSKNTEEKLKPDKPVNGKVSSSKKATSMALETFAKATSGEFAKVVAREIVKNLTTIGKIRPFTRESHTDEPEPPPEGKNLIIIDSSVLVDGRILPIVNSGFICGTFVIAECVMAEVQFIADSSDPLRRAKGRRGLEVAGKLKGQKNNDLVTVKIVKDDVPDRKEVDLKLLELSKRWKARLLTVDFNLAQSARAQGIKVLNVNELAQALKISIVPGEEMTIKITHEGKEREQGVGYLTDGTMVVVENCRDKVGMEVAIVVSKVHLTAAGQLFFARLR